MPVTKNDFRAKLLKERKVLTADADRLTGLSQSLFALLERLCPKRLGSYSPMRGEPDFTDKLTVWAAATGCEIYWPAMTAENMVYRRWTADVRLEKDALGIESPAGEASDVPPDVILLPCVGHDAKGHRLGYGKGCFDKYLSEHPDVTTVGLSFEKLAVPHSVFEAHDQPLDWIVTEMGAEKI